MRALLAATAVLALAPSASASIVFSSDLGVVPNQPHRYVIRPDGSGRSELAVPDGTLSPDATLVARADGPTVSVAPLRSGPTQTIAHLPTDARVASIAWSRDGTRLAILATRDNVPYIWTIRRDGSALTALGIGHAPSLSPDGTRVVLVSAGYVWVVPATGGTRRRLAVGQNPEWAPRASLIAYSGPRGITLIRPDGTHRRILVHTTRNIVWDVLAATWSPTGRRLAVVQGAGSQIKRTKLEVVDVRTRRIRVVAASLPGGLLDRPAFSPDERRVAYVTSKATYMLPDEPYRYDADEQVFVVGTSGRGRRQVTHELPSGRYAEIVWTRGGIVYSTAQYGNDLELYTIEADGSGLTQLTRDLVDETFPAWSPDGAKIAFVRSNAETSWPLVAKPGVYVLDVARRTERRIVATTRYDRDAAPAWAPDGSALALVYRGRLGIARPDGTQLGLFQTLGRPQHPTWSPDATQLAFSDDEPGAGTAIYTINRDGTNLKAISRLAYANDPAWSPDGEWIAYEGQRGNGPPFGLWVVHPDGSGERMIAEGAVQGAPSWSPDGSELVYSLGGELHVVRLDGTGDRVLLAAPGNELADPSWH